MLGGFARIDGTAKNLPFVSCHCIPLMIWSSRRAGRKSAAHSILCR
jgi:hypothetical protein